MRKQTPWGIADNAIELAKGIILYSTPSHGGIWLSAKRRETIKIKYPIPEFKNFLNTYEWWEEDCDWCIPYLIFSDDIKSHGNESYFEKNLNHAKEIASFFHPDFSG